MCRRAAAGRCELPDPMPQHHKVPLVVLQGVQAHLDLPDLRVARLACKEWARELAGQVQSVSLDPPLWQTADGPEQQQQQLGRLVGTFWSFKAAHLHYDPEQPISSQALQQAVEVLSSIPSLRKVVVHNLCGDEAWQAVLIALQPLSACKRLTHLELLDVALPSAAGLAPLAALSPSLTALTLASHHSNQLLPGHVEALAGLQQLTELRVSFRATSGTALYGPLALDPLGQLPRLEHLDLVYTGLAELASNMGFTSPSPLAAATSLRYLSLTNIPLASCEGLWAARKHLTSLHLQQLNPLTQEHLRPLSSGFKQLRHLHLAPVPLELLPTVGSLQQLQQLTVKIWAPAHAGQHLPADAQLAALAGLTRLQSLSLAGPILVTQQSIQTLAAGLQGLTQLQLHVALPDGTQGLQDFACVQHLRLKPYRARRAAHDGGNSDNLLEDASRSVCVWPLALPPSLVTLEGEDVWFRSEHLDLQQQFLEEHVPLAQTFPHTSTMSSLSLRSNSLSREDLALPDLWLLPGLTSVTLEHPNLTAGHLDQVRAHCGSSLTELHLSTLEPHLRPQESSLGSPSSSSDSDSSRSWARSSSRGWRAQETAPPAVVAAPLANLDRLPSFGEAIAEYLGVPLGGTSTTSSEYSSAGVSLGDGLQLLGQFEGLQRLSLELGDKKLLAPKAKRAIAGLGRLRELSLAVATDTPAAAAKELAGWLGRMVQLRQLQVMMVGPGGCGAAQQGLLQQLQVALPGCEVRAMQL